MLPNCHGLPSEISRSALAVGPRHLEERGSISLPLSLLLQSRSELVHKGLAFGPLLVIQATCRLIQSPEPSHLGHVVLVRHEGVDELPLQAEALGLSGPQRGQEFDPLDGAGTGHRHPEVA